MSPTLPDITLTEDDFHALCALIEQAPASARGGADRLDVELARARIVPVDEIAPDVVTMRCRVVVEELTSGVERVVTLVFPHESNADEGRISVMSPLGSALIGLSTGQIIDWAVPGRPRARYRIGAVDAPARSTPTVAAP